MAVNPVSAVSSLLSSMPSYKSQADSALVSPFSGGSSSFNTGSFTVGGSGAISNTTLIVIGIVAALFIFKGKTWK
jgi:hypothetical protein